MFPKACVDRLPGRMNAQESNVVEVLLPFWASWQLATLSTCPVLLPVFVILGTTSKVLEAAQINHLGLMIS